MRKLLLFLISIILLTACGKGASNSPAEPDPTPVIVQAEVKTENAVQETTKEPVLTQPPSNVPTDAEPETHEAESEAEQAAQQTSEAAPDKTPEPEPMATITPVTDEQLDAGYLDAFFNDSVLVGDSLVAGLSGYVLSEKEEGKSCLGELQLVSASALTLKKAVEAEQGLRVGELRLRNRYMTVSQVVSTLEAKKLFLMLGVSDPRWYTGEELVAAYDTLIRIVRTDHPDIAIYIHSIMPMVKDYAKQVEVSAETNRAVNKLLEAYCEENRFTYIQLADLVRDEEGYLVYGYSAGDYRFHLNKYGKEIWVRCLREVARNEYDAGIWNPEGN